MEARPAAAKSRAVLTGLTILALFALPRQASSDWGQDVQIDHSPGTDLLQVRGTGDPSRVYALHTDLASSGAFRWMRSSDDGRTWNVLRDVMWGPTPGVSAALEVVEGLLVTAWASADGAMPGEVMDWDTGTPVVFFEIADESPRQIRQLVMEACSEDLIIAAASMVQPQTEQAFVRAYRSTNGGQSWSAPVTIETGPILDPDHIGAIAITAPADGCPIVHIAYVQEGQAFLATTTDGGASWASPQALQLGLDVDSTIGVAAHGTEVLVVGESQTGQIVSLHSTDGVQWSSGLLIDAPETLDRFPHATADDGTYHVFYRKADQRIAHRSTTLPGQAGGWSAEEYATEGTTERPFSSHSRGAGAVLGFVNSADAGNPYSTTLLDVAGVSDAQLPHHPPLVFPQPSRGGVTIQASAFPGGSVSGVIVDSAGRLIARLSGSSKGDTDPGRTELRWDGRDRNGRPVPSGTYFFRMGGGVASGHGRTRASVTILR